MYALCAIACGFLQVLNSFGILYIFKSLKIFWNLAVLSRRFWFWKLMYLYKHIFNLGGNTSHTLSAHGSIGLSYLTFKEAELIKGYLNY